ncbi:hypothetical protein bpr_I0375 [Butyrivibrio proteoclasticus B316]|uniref:Uncharacterized protein n=1 Tax=Butyrivibrio proteoclasticus (strain ATCC 51982 / DSM 14932 / B316) TaxID=515622 RepID=E0RZC6_BUTPB|nr:hypothetical protein bpr_I0375 [Butyrivibrio proteoclasticus B316]
MLYNIKSGCGVVFPHRIFPIRIIETVFMSGIIFILYIRVLQGADLTSFLPQLAVFAVGGIKMLPSMSTISRSATQIINS